MYDGIPPPGIIVGLAYNSYGGAITYIEATKYSFETQKEPEVINKEIKIETNQVKKETAADNENKKLNKDDKNTQPAQSSIRRKGTLKLTGSLGDVMQQSIHIAYTFSKYFLNEFFENDYLQKTDVHIHFPSGAS